MVLVALGIAASGHFGRDGLGVRGVVGHDDRERLGVVATSFAVLVHDHVRHGADRQTDRALHSPSARLRLNSEGQDTADRR